MGYVARPDGPGFTAERRMGRPVAPRKGPVRRCPPIPSLRHRHLAIASVTALALFGIADDDSALGVARVGLGGGNLVVAVNNDGDQNATHGLIVQPFTDITRDGFRVRQDALGVATITTSDPDCSANPVFNDVVCSGARGSLNVTMRGGADRVTLRDQNAASEACFTDPGGHPGHQRRRHPRRGRRPLPRQRLLGGNVGRARGPRLARQRRWGRRRRPAPRRPVRRHPDRRRRRRGRGRQRSRGAGGERPAARQQPARPHGRRGG